MKSILIIMVLLISFSLNAQALEILYKETHKLDKYKDDAYADLIQNKLRAMDSEMKLSINATESLYTSATDKTQTNRVYKNFSTRLMVSQENILERKFLIEDAIGKPKWILSSEEKEICGIKCIKAENQRGEIAWFSKDISIGDGPSIYYGLPGLILEIENEVKTITAEKITTALAENQQIKAPSGSKKVSREEFTKIQKQKLTELGGDGNTSGVKIIKM